MTKRRFALLVVVVLVLAAIPSVASFAQTFDPTVPPAPAPTVPNCTAVAPAEALQFVIRLGGFPVNFELLAVYVCTGFSTNVIGNTEDLFGYDCATGITFYKVENTGRQGLWDVPNKICSGDQLSLRTGGTGHYIIYGTDSVIPTGLPAVIVGGA